MTHVLDPDLDHRPARGSGRNFQRLWLGEGVSLLGNSTSSVLLELLAVLHLHAGAGWMGALTAAAWLPWLVVGLAAGAWVDPLSPRRVMIAADLVAAAALASIPIAWWAGVLTLWQLLAVGLSTGTASVFFRPAYVKLIPLVVPDAQLHKANSRLAGTESAAQIIGPGLAGQLARLGSAATGVLFDAASFCVSAYCLWRIRIDEAGVRSPARDGLLARIRDGVRLVAHDRYLRTFTVIGGIGNFGLTGFNVLLVLYWSRTLHLSAGAIGWLFMLGSCGGVLGAALVDVLTRRFGTGTTSTALLLVAGPASLLIGFPRDHRMIWLSVAGLTVMDACVVAGNALRGAWRQRYVPARLMARVTTTSQVINLGSMPIAALVAGWLGGAIGVRPTILALAAVFALSDVAVLLTRAGRTRELPVRCVEAGR
ncbi:MAG TPA: MFS transporter [Jatrophihabitans sp.]|nr:MFS transporter [Jatrophihabitans sp.]